MSTVTDSTTASKAAIPYAPLAPFNSRFVIPPKDLYTSNTRWETVWKVAQATTLVAISAIAVTAGLLVTAWNPETIFYFSLGLSLALPIVEAVNSFFNEKIRNCQHQATKFERIAKIYDDLIKKKPAELESRFQKYGISRSSIAQFSRIDGGFRKLAAGLAHFIYTNETSIELHKTMKEHGKNACAEKDPAKKHHYAYITGRYDIASYISRMHAAYDLALIKNPFSQKALADLGDVQEREPQNVLLDRLYAHSDNIFYFHDNKKPPVTFTQLGRSLKDLIDHPNSGGAAALHPISRQLLA